MCDSQISIDCNCIARPYLERWNLLFQSLSAKLLTSIGLLSSVLTFCLGFVL